MTLHRSLQWIAGLFVALVALAVLLITLVGWNWARGPIERIVLEKTGRVLAINGDLTLHWGWPLPRVQARTVTFANPAWAKEPQMLKVDKVEVSVDLPQLLRRHIVLPLVHLEQPVVYLEQGLDNRKSWLLDLNQQEEGARIEVGQLSLDKGVLGYDDVAAKTSIRADLSTQAVSSQSVAQPGAAGVVFAARGQYKGLTLKASGQGGAVLALRDERTPYPLTVDAMLGHTGVRANGTVTSLLKFTAIDMRLALRGDSLDELYPLTGIATPATRAYATEGHLLRNANTWRYDNFSGRVGDSDLAGSVQVEMGGQRPVLVADLRSKLLDIEDLGPLIGARPGSVAIAKNSAAVAPPALTKALAQPASARVLPDLPFKTDRWSSVDAEVSLTARAIRRAKALPLEDFVTHLSLRDSVLKLSPLDVGVAGGKLNAVISLDGRKTPILANAQIRARKIQMGQLFPTFALSKTSIGQINGEFDLKGQGNSVGKMLATADGKVGLVVAGGEISKLMMETAGLHLWEILELKMTGDRPVKLRCAVADFDVKQGKLTADALIFDTEVTTLIGTGNIDLAQETLDLTFNQKTKNTSPLALRSPLYVRGNLAQPVVGVDKGQVAVRALGALALGVVNPLLALIPLIDAGPGKDSDCGQLVRDARALPRAAVSPATNTAQKTKATPRP